jgi:hypothetical protein
MQNLVTPRPGTGTRRTMVYLAGRHGSVEVSLPRALRSTYGRDIGRKGGAIFKRGGVSRACELWAVDSTNHFPSITMADFQAWVSVVHLHPYKLDVCERKTSLSFPEPANLLKRHSYNVHPPDPRRA